jgi:uroporphyrinogen-III decarboxylase
MGPEQVLVANLNPVTDVLQGDPLAIAAQLGERHLAAGPRFIVGAGCEIPPTTPATNLQALTAYAHEHGPKPV